MKKLLVPILAGGTFVALTIPSAGAHTPASAHSHPRIAYLTRVPANCIRAIAVDPKGNSFVTGWLAPASVSRSGWRRYGSGGGTSDAFLMKIDSRGKVAFRTALGGAGDEEGSSIAVSGSGVIYVAGRTISSDFPVLAGLARASGAGTKDVFVVRIDGRNGRLLSSTYLGARDEAKAAQGAGIGVDQKGDAYVAGTAAPDSFPGARQLAAWPSERFEGSQQAFVARVEPFPNAVPIVAYLGTADAANIAVRPSGEAYVTRELDPFVARVKASLDGIVFSKRLAFTDLDFEHMMTRADAITVDGAGSSYVTGHDSGDVFLTKLSGSGKVLFFHQSAAKLTMRATPLRWTRGGIASWQVGQIRRTSQ